MKMIQVTKNKSVTEEEYKRFNDQRPYFPIFFEWVDMIKSIEEFSGPETALFAFYKVAEYAKTGIPHTFTEEEEENYPISLITILLTCAKSYTDHARHEYIAKAAGGKTGGETGIKVQGTRQTINIQTNNGMRPLTVEAVDLNIAQQFASDINQGVIEMPAEGGNMLDMAYYTYKKNHSISKSL